ncbi:hypothetical protein [Methanolobus profundi]|nr:hypothetical protein [Methanolobus profundi]
MSEYIMITWWDYKMACLFVGGVCMACGLLIGELKYNRRGLSEKVRKFLGEF